MARAEAGFDFRSSDYTPIWNARVKRLEAARADPATLQALKIHYRGHIAQFISDMAVTVDPRVKKPRSPIMPFLLFPKQVELIEWVEERYHLGESGVLVKSRDVGASWVAMAWAVSKCLFERDFMVGFGSAKEDKVDQSGNPDTLFYKARMFLQNLPPEFRAGWQLGKNSQHMRLSFPETGSSITGEAGDNIGRGGRKSVFFVDESAHVERPKLIDASLAATTDCRIDMSSVNGMANSFYERAHSGMPRFDFGWRDDPRKDQGWYDRKTTGPDALDPVIVAQEIDCNFSASAEGVIIPASYVQAAVGLHIKLGLKPTGARVAGLDIADRGKDKNALAGRYGCLLDHLESWSGKESDIYSTVARAFSLCDQWGYDSFFYDADGMGAGVRGDARVLNEHRTAPGGDRRPGAPGIAVREHRGSAAVVFPEKKTPRTDRKNEDFFANYKAQAWWNLRFKFEESYKASQGMPYDPDGIICIDPALPELTRLCAELSQPQYKQNPAGKMLVDKQPDEALSPNLADAVVIAFAPRKGQLNISDELLLNLSGRRLT